MPDSLQVGERVFVDILGTHVVGTVKATKEKGILEIPEAYRSHFARHQFEEYDVLIEHDQGHRQYGVYQRRQVIKCH